MRNEKFEAISEETYELLKKHIEARQGDLLRRQTEEFLRDWKKPQWPMQIPLKVENGFRTEVEYAEVVQAARRLEKKCTCGAQFTREPHAGWCDL